MKTPVVIHRAIYGSLERFIGIIVEHFAGAFPVWIAPIQVEIIPIADRHIEYAEKLQRKMKEFGLRVEVNNKNDSFSAKIRNAQLQKIPYMMILGDKEVESNKVSLRLRDGRDLGIQDIDSTLNQIKKVYNERSLELWK
uniref:Anticodon-binding domain-containing protein n=1 Tax=candidate division WWE3 bacterium TaxID=2053526 RepID=A0A7C4XHA9_UNCKA